MATALDTMLGRRDMALVPMLSLSALGGAIAVSTLLRPGERSGATAMIAIAFAILSLGLAWLLMIDRPLATAIRSRLSTYVTIIVGASVFLGLGAIRDQGLSTVPLTALVIVATYTSLVLPRRWSVPALGLLMIELVVIHVFTPTAPLIDAIVIAALIVAGWLVGLLGHQSHTQASLRAFDRSRTDELTRTLNRRGFFEEFELMLSADVDQTGPLALLLLDIDGFKAINDTEGHSAGDDVLRWVGSVLAAEVPAGAAVGRMGGDEFAIALPQTTTTESSAVADGLRVAMSVRIGVSVGGASVAATEKRSPQDADRLMRLADAAMYQAKERGRPLRSPGGPSALSLASSHQFRAADSSARPAVELRRSQRSRWRTRQRLTYADVLSNSMPTPDKARAGSVVEDPWFVTGGFLVIGLAGVIILPLQLLHVAPSVWTTLLTYVGPFWVLSQFACAAFFATRQSVTKAMLQVAHVGGALVIGVGIGVMMLSDDGIATPISATLALKVMFDSYAMSRDRARTTLVIVLACFCLVAALGPPDALWAAPYGITVLFLAYAVGHMARRAFTDAVHTNLKLAHTDVLTGLANRSGLETEAAAQLTRASRNGRSVGLLLLDLDDFKGVNDTLGHAAGDVLLCRVAETIRGLFPEAAAIARIGGDEFAVLLDETRPSAAERVAARLTEELAPLIGASVGHAVAPNDATTLDALMVVADRRSYAKKRSRRDEQTDAQACN